MGQPPLAYTRFDSKGRSLFNVTAHSQEDGTWVFILTEHPERPKDVPHLGHVSVQAFSEGHEIIQLVMDERPGTDPESIQIYVEQPESGADGQPQFCRYHARPSEWDRDPAAGVTDGVPDDYVVVAWTLHRGKPVEKAELEEKVGHSIATAAVDFRYMEADHDWDMSL